MEPAPSVGAPLKSLSPEEVFPKAALSERGLQGTAFGAERLPARRGSGTAGRRLSAPEPASYAVELPVPAEKGVPAARGAAEERGAELSPKALSDRWERDSRRYDGGFTLY